MEQSLLDKISILEYQTYDGWRNGKTGRIDDVLCNGVFRFIEEYKDRVGWEKLVHQKMEDNPIVCIGIAAYWLNNRKGTETVRQMYENYTQQRFEQFKDSIKDDAETWDWDEEDWKRFFYLKAAEREAHWNKMSEPLFDYISESDAKRIRPVMENYIKYLEKCLASFQNKPQEKISGVLDTKLAREIFAECIEKGWMHETESGYQWEGIPDCRGKIAQLSYLCGKIYGFKYDKISGNSGKEYPEKELNKLFNEQYLEKQLLQVYAADKPQKWRTLIDEIFE